MTKLFNFLFLQENLKTRTINQVMLVKIKESEEEENPHYAFPSLDALIAHLHKVSPNIVPTTETLRILRGSVIPSLFQQIIRNINQQSENPEDTEINLWLDIEKKLLNVWLETVPKDNPLVQLKKPSPISSNIFTVLHPSTPGKEALSLPHLNTQPRIKSMFPSTKLQDLSNQDAHELVASSIQRTENKFSDTQKEDLLHRIASHIKKFADADPKHLKLSTPKFSNNASTRSAHNKLAVWLSYGKNIPETHVEDNVLLEIFFHGTDMNILYFHLYDERGTLLNHASFDLPMSNDPVVQQKWSGFVGIQKIADSIMNSAVKALKKLRTSPRREEALAKREEEEERAKQERLEDLDWNS